MVAGSITEEVAVLAVPAERLWKVAFGETKSVLLPKACAGYIDAVEVEVGGDGGPGSVTTIKVEYERLDGGQEWWRPTSSRTPTCSPERQGTDRRRSWLSSCLGKKYIQSTYT